MASCPLVSTCIFFNDEMGNKPDLITKTFKLRFCQGSNEHCARWQVFSALGRDFVPRDLYPNQEEKVKDILEKVNG